jgi:predicted acetyltransferase
MGKLMLSRGLEKAKGLNFQRLKIACDEKNHASISIIRANGGESLERIYDRRTRLYVMRFIIELYPPLKMGPEHAER